MVCLGALAGSCPYAMVPPDFRRVRYHTAAAVWATVSTSACKSLTPITAALARTWTPTTSTPSDHFLLFYRRERNKSSVRRRRGGNAYLCYVITLLAG